MNLVFSSIWFSTKRHMDSRQCTL